MKKIFCIPGNAGTNEICKNLDLDILDFEQLYNSIKQNDIKLIIVGPEVPLVQGITDFLENKNIKVFGFKQKASQLEGSKIFMKNLCYKV